MDGKHCSATKSIYDYIGDHLGYRFEVTEAIFPAVLSRSQPLTFNATIVNRGFSALHNPRPVTLVLISTTMEGKTMSGKSMGQGRRQQQQQQRGQSERQHEMVVFQSLLEDASPASWQPFEPGDPSFTPLNHQLNHTILPQQLAALTPGLFKLGLSLPDLRALNATRSNTGSSSASLLLDKEFCVRLANNEMEWWSDSAGQHGVNILGSVELT